MEPAGAEGRWRRWGARAALFLALTIVTWPVSDVVAGPSLDPSWMLALELAHAEGVDWGTDLIFTYGPLGIGAHPIAISSATLLASLVLAFAMQLLVVAVLFVALRRQYGPAASALLTFLIASVVGSLQSDSLLVSAFGISVLALTAPRRGAQHAAWALAVGGGALAAFAMLVKLNTGVAAAAIVAVALLAAPSPKRTLALAAGSGLVTLVALWLVAGQPLPALDDYLRNSIETVSGYVESMGLNAAGPAGEWQLLVLLGSAIVVTALAWTSFPELSRRRLAAMIVAVLLVHYAILREVLVRHEILRGAYLVVLVPVVLMLPWPRYRRGISLAIAAMLTVAYLSTYPQSPGDIWAPKAHARAMAEQFEAALDDDELDRLVAVGRTAIGQSETPVPPEVIEAVRGRCVHAEPVEVAAVWANDLDWCPLPAFQSYSAYTSRLDEINAGRYADPEKGPDGVIRGVYAIDFRRPAWESPRAMLALLCNFRSVAESAIGWHALVRVRERCGEPRPAGTLEGELGAPIELPPSPDDAVLLAHVHGMEIEGVERLKLLFWRPAERFISIDGGSPYRVVPDTVDDGLIVSVPPTEDFPVPFNLGVDAKTLTATVSGQEDGEVTIELTEVPIGR